MPRENLLNSIFNLYSTLSNACVLENIIKSISKEVYSTEELTRIKTGNFSNSLCYKLLADFLLRVRDFDDLDGLIDALSGYNTELTDSDHILILYKAGEITSCI